MIGLLMLIISGIPQAQGLWRYHSSDGAFESLFVNSEIELSHIEGDVGEVSQWQLPEGSPCQIQNASDPVTSVICTEPGIHSISLIEDTINGSVSHSKLLSVVYDQYCYSWYVTRDKSFYSNVVVLDEIFQYYKLPWTRKEYERMCVIDFLKVWLINRSQLSEEERNNTASVPSQRSKVLSNKLYHTGLFPQVTSLLTGPQKYAEQCHTLGFNETEGYWEVVTLTYNYNQPSYRITSGAPVSLYNCFIREVDVILPKNTNEIYNLTDATPGMILTPDVVGHSYPYIVEGRRFSRNAALYITGDSVYHTVDGFLSTQKLQLPSFEDQTIYTIKGAVFTLTFLVLWTHEGVLLANQLTYNISKIQGINTEDIKGMVGRDCCAAHEMKQDIELVLWSNDTFYIIQQITDNYMVDNTTSLPTEIIQQLGHALEHVNIIDVCIETSTGYLAVAMSMEDGNYTKIGVFLYDSRLDIWTLLDSIEASAENISDYRVRFIREASTSVLLWDNERVLQVQERNTTEWEVLYNEDNILSDGTDYIKQVLVWNNEGDLVVLMSSNRLFYGILPLRQLVELDPFELRDKPCALTTDVLRQVWLIYEEVDGPHRMRYPLSTELKSRLHKESVCPYYHFERSTKEEIVYLDMSDTVTLSVCLVYKKVLGHVEDIISFRASPLKNVQVSVQFYVEESLTNRQENKTVILSHEGSITSGMNMSEFDYYDIVKNETGLGRVELKPIHGDLTCPQPAHMVANVYVGCPKTRHIVIERPVEEDHENCEKFKHNYTWTISAHDWKHMNGTTGDFEKVMTYDYEKLGCPIRVYNLDKFSLKLILHDDDTATKPMTANFVLWEVNGHTGYTYNSTMFQVGCQTVGHTWDSLRQEANGTDKTDDELWGPWNHIDCFQGNFSKDDKVILKSQFYEVMNNTGRVSLKMPIEFDTVFVFNVRVVDPDFSYCILETQFAVEVYGALPPLKIEIMGICLLVCMILVFLAMFISYIRLKVKMYGENRNDFRFDENEEDSD